MVIKKIIVFLVDMLIYIVAEIKITINKVKIFVTVPLTYLDKIRDAVSAVDAGIIGNYRCCTFAVKGVGTFLPNQQAHPFIGKNGKIEFVPEAKIEFICDLGIVKKVLTVLRAVHPYEEPAIDIVPLLDETQF